MADKREYLLSLLGRETISPAANRAGDALEDMGDSARDAARDAERLDRQIAETQTSIHKLAEEIRRTGDVSLFKDLARQDRDLKKLTGIKDMFAKLGDDGAQGFAASFSARIGPLLARAPLHPALLAALAGATPAIGALVSAGVLAGLGGGVVAAGLALAAKDQRVKAEAEALGKDLGAILGRASRSFVPAALGAMEQVRRSVTRLEGDLEATFRAGATYVAPLTRTLTNLVEGIAPRLPRVLERAAPVFKALEDSATVLGRATGAALDAISEGAAGAGMMVRDLVANVAVSVRAIGELIGFLSKAYATVRLATATDKTAVISQMAADQAATASYKAELDKLIGSLANGAGAARIAATEVRSLDEMLNDFADAATTAWNAETRFGEALAEVTKKAAHHGAGIDSNTKRGRANRDMLEKLASQTRDSTKALEGMAGGQSKANAIMNQGYSRFVAVAMAMGKSKAEADRLARSLGLIPKTTKTDHKSNAAAAKAAAEGVRQKLLALERTYYASIMVRYRYTNPGALGAVGQLGMREHGGPVKKGHAYVVGERRPEVFVPDRDGRVLPSVEQYARNGGAGFSGGRGGTVRVVISADGMFDALVRQLRNFVRVEGQGDVQVALGT